LRSSVLVWPNQTEVDETVRQWAAGIALSRPELLGLGYFGSYAGGDWGVGSDLDIVAVVSVSDEPFDRRGLR
jgi:predicted nucleotidyltransferase